MMKIKKEKQMSKKKCKRYWHTIVKTVCSVLRKKEGKKRVKQCYFDCLRVFSSYIYISDRIDEINCKKQREALRFICIIFKVFQIWNLFEFRKDKSCGRF